MSFRVIIAGSSGMVGRGVLLECLESSRVSSVLVINRRTLSLDHPKLIEVLVDDLFDLESVKEKLSGFDACFFCVGVSSAGQTEESYSKITYELAVGFARVVLSQNENCVFCYVSAQGADSLEKSRMMWARVKGRAENEILAMPFKSAHVFRPGYIQPLRSIKSRTPAYNLLYQLFGPLYILLKHFPSLATNTTNIGRAMINTIHGDVTDRILGNSEINSLANSRPLSHD